ncbi:MAG: divalent-cation tolerance protein CutA [Anaerolineales bacterium]
MDKCDSIRLVLVTAPDPDIAGQIAKTLLEKGLAACVNIFSGLRSLYRWEGKIQDDNEVLLMIKTRADLIDKDLIPIVQELHPYQFPEIIALPVVGGEQSFLDWIFSETTRVEKKTPED